MLKSLAVVFAVSVVGCAAVEDGAAEGPALPDFGAGKADVVDHVDDRGLLSFDTARADAFTEDFEFHAYQLDVRDGARVRLEITRLGTAKKLDTTLFVFGPGNGGQFGTDSIAFDDDSGWGPHSRITGLDLEGGEYLVVVGTYDARGRGQYRLLASCESGDCAPLPEPAAGCDEVVANNILACMSIQVADSAADPESTPLTRAEALALCTDGEALGPVFDNLCGAPQPMAFCAAGFDAFAQTMGPACAEELAPFAVQCVFGETYRDLERSRDVAIGWRRELSSASALSDVERAQVVLALQSAGHTDITTADEAFARADDSVINQTALWDRTSARAFVAYELGAGDTSVGAYFAHGTTERVAVISDGFLERCSAGVGPQGEDCSSNADCDVGVCMGRSEAFDLGRCTVLSGFGEQSSCSADDPCDIGEGLICAGLSFDSEGICFPGWMRGSFAESELELPIPDADPEGLTRTQNVYGLATVPMDVELDLELSHPVGSQVRVTLIDSHGTERTVFDGATSNGFIRLRRVPVGFAGDETIGGPWTLRVVDTTGGGEGVLHGWTLHLGSRFD